MLPTGYVATCLLLAPIIATLCVPFPEDPELLSLSSAALTVPPALLEAPTAITHTTLIPTLLASLGHARTLADATSVDVLRPLRQMASWPTPSSDLPTDSELSQISPPALYSILPSGSLDASHFSPGPLGLASPQVSTSLPSTIRPYAINQHEDLQELRPQVMAYYPLWSGGDFPPEKIDFDRVDWIDCAFMVLDRDGNFGWDSSGEGEDLLARLVAAAHNQNKKVKLSIGGWTGSEGFSAATSNDKSRRRLVSGIVTILHQYDLDGIDIDWEYPAQQGAGKNIVDPENDTADFLAFLKLLRKDLPPWAKLSAAATTMPWIGRDGKPVRDMSKFAAVLDWVLIMNYDTWGSSDNPGPNSALSDACHNSSQPNANALAAVGNWVNAGFPASKLVLGVASYGYVSRSSATRLRTRSSPYHKPSILFELNPLGYLSDLAPVLVSTDLTQLQADVFQGGVIFATDESGGTEGGQIQFREILRQGALKYISKQDSSPAAARDRKASRRVYANRSVENFFTGASGFTRHWDECSGTPFLVSQAAKQVITYDDPQSLEMKAMLVKQMGMLGVNMFDIHGDTDHWDLFDAVRNGLGVS